MSFLSLVSAEEFDSISSTHSKGNFHQTSEMASFRTALGWDVHTLVLQDGKKVVAALLLAGKNGRYEVTMGPLLDFENSSRGNDLLGQIAAYVRKIGGHTAEIYPFDLYRVRKADGTVTIEADNSVFDLFKNAGWTHKGFTVDYDSVANRWAFVKDLSKLKNEQDLLSSYRQTTRQTINKLESEKYSIKKLSYKELEIAKSLIDSSYDRNDVHKRDLNYYRQLHKNFDGNIEFLVVYHEDVPISTGVFIAHPNELVYFASGADTEYRHLYGGHYLQHYVMSRAIKHGVKRYNFYGVSGHFKNNPLLVYKSGFRGYIEEYVGGFSLTVNPTKKLFNKVLSVPKKTVKKALGK